MKTTITSLFLLTLSLKLHAAHEVPKEASDLIGKKGTMTVIYNGEVRTQDTGIECEIREGFNADPSIRIESEARDIPIFSFEEVENEKLSRSTKGDTVIYVLDAGDLGRTAARYYCGDMALNVYNYKTILTFNKSLVTIEKRYSCGIFFGGKKSTVSTCKV